MFEHISNSHAYTSIDEHNSGDSGLKRSLIIFF
jgi:hypothetical protein